MTLRRSLPFLVAGAVTQASAQTVVKPSARNLENRVAQVLPQVIVWRRDIHQHPELSNREVRTAKLVAAEPQQT